MKEEWNGSERIMNEISKKVKWNRSYKKMENEIEGSKKIMEQDLIKK